MEYHNAIRSFELALIAKRGDYAALKGIEDAKSSIRKLEQQRY